MQNLTYIPIIGDTTISKCIEVRYDLGKTVALDMWDKPKDKMSFEDIFHDTLYRCMKSLGQRKMPEEELHAYFFKAFRINMVRHFKYAYNKLQSGIEVESMLIPTIPYYDGHLDGFDMLNLVKDKFGSEAQKMLWYQLQGHTYRTLNEMYGKDSYYLLNKIKNYLKSYYDKEVKFYRCNFPLHNSLPSLQCSLH